MPAKAAKKIIGEVIRSARLRHHLTADDVARGCNVSRSRVYQWETASRILPKNLPALSVTLNIPVRRLQTVNGRR